MTEAGAVPRSAAFMGNMNAMPMTYALQLREQGWSVKYFVDTPPSDKLSRPELKFPSIRYPYPDWIIERRIRSQLLGVFGPQWLLRDIIAVLRQADVVFLSGLYLGLARFLRPTQQVLFLSFGADLDAWCDRDSIARLTGLFAGRIGAPLARLVVEAAVGRMIASLRSVSAILTFPEGLSAPAERVIARELAGSAVVRIPRYDISFADLPAAEQIRPAAPADTLRIICGTRHTFREHPGLTERENKGTDIIIRALGRYRRAGRRPFEVHFFEKGLDVREARQLCVAEGIDSCVVWHPEMPFQDFLALHQTCHIAFDQVGSHWVGGGMYAMYLGLPVIANSRRDALEQYWGESPMCHAEDESAIVQWLIALEDERLRRDIGERSRSFALRYFDSTLTVRRILDFAQSTRQHTAAVPASLRRMIAGATSVESR